MDHETLILFTRFPVAGRTKTRLIGRLGAEGAARLQREMTEHVLARVWPLTRRRGVQLEIRFDGGSRAEMRRWLGNGFNFVPQGGGDLGERMARASRDALGGNARAVIIIGTDCPEMSAPIVESAFEALRGHRLVLGPAKDGGYYLVGQTIEMPELYDGIPWGAGDVLERSVTAARRIGVEAWLLAELSDVDEPTDLAVWEKARDASRALSVIIPTLDDAAQLSVSYGHAAAVPTAEIIVADGGSRDGTPGIARSLGAKVVISAGTRARQMNAGAAMARGDILLFLHADTWLPEGWDEAVLAALRRPNVVGGAFRLGIRDPFRGRWLIERAVNLRSRLWRMPYGDQAVFVRRWAFDELGGFPELPIMEDYEFVRRLRHLGELALTEAAVLTSGRRWQRLGALRTTLVNQLVVLGYHAGLPPEKLGAFYRGRATPRASILELPEPGPRIG